MWVIVGKCGGLWWGGAVDWWWGGGKGKHFRLWDGGSWGCADCGVCKFSQILTFSKKF